MLISYVDKIIGDFVDFYIMLVDQIFWRENGCTMVAGHEESPLLGTAT
jgi:hypothetical protein